MREKEKKIEGVKKKKKAYNTCGSQAVTHPSTEQARHCLTSVIRREPVYSVWYGRRHKVYSNNSPYAVLKALNSRECKKTSVKFSMTIFHGINIDKRRA